MATLPTMCEMLKDSIAKLFGFDVQGIARKFEKR
jgi:hypothetical protein